MITNNVHTIKSYDEMLYDSRPVSINEFLSNKYDNVHNELFNDALSKFFKDFSNNIVSSKFVYEFFKTMQNHSDNFNIFYNYVKSKNNSYINNILRILKVNDKDLLKKLFNQTNKLLNTVKQDIADDINNQNILKEVSSISNINDFRIYHPAEVTFLEAENDNDNYDTFISYKIELNDSDEIQLTDKKVFKSELNDYVFILEETEGIRIGFNANGEWVLILGNNEYENFEAFLKENKKMNLHSKNLITLFKDIVLNEFKSYHKIIEIKNSEYWMPSSICIISNVRPYKKELISLKKYWNMLQGFIDTNIDDLKYTTENILDSELIHLNYINGTAKMRSKSNDLEYEIPFKYLNRDTRVSEEMMITNTFGKI